MNGLESGEGTPSRGVKRKGISKKLRFSVFSRDGFTCVYCGRQPPDVCLQVEHVIPVCQGGTNDEANLRCSCAECNAGKGANTIEQAQPTEAARLAMAQEIAEQEVDARMVVEAHEKAKQLHQSIVNLICDTLSTKSCNIQTVTAIKNLMREFDPALVMMWIQKAALKAPENRGSPETNFIKYVCGCARMTREGKGW
jgi:hypothetical protein